MGALPGSRALGSRTWTHPAHRSPGRRARIWGGRRNPVGSDDQPARPPLLRTSRLGSRRRREDALAWRRPTGRDPLSDLTESLGTDTLRTRRPNGNRLTTSCPHTRIRPVRAALNVRSVAFGRTLSAVNRPDGGSVTGHPSSCGAATTKYLWCAGLLR